MLCSNVMELIEQIAPPHTALSFDNIGLLVGSKNMQLQSILLALDITNNVIDEAIHLGANLIITHHPFIFSSIKNITTNSHVGRMAIKLIKNDIAVFTAHTNLDISSIGTNATLFDMLNLTNKRLILEEIGLGLIGSTAPTTLEAYATYVRDLFKVESMRYIGEKNHKICTVGISTGAFDRTIINIAKDKNCDVLITGDVKYHDAHEAIASGLALIDATHYATENIVLPSLKKYLKAHMPSVKVAISTVNLQPFRPC